MCLGGDLGFSTKSPEFLIVLCHIRFALSHSPTETKQCFARPNFYFYIFFRKARKHNLCLVKKSQAFYRLPFLIILFFKICLHSTWAVGLKFQQVWDLMPVLRGKPGTSSRATQALNCWAISSPPPRKNGFNGPNNAFGCFDF